MSQLLMFLNDYQDIQW